MTTVASWLKQNDFEDLEGLLSEVLGIKGELDVDELCGFSKDDINDFFTEIKSSHNVKIELRRRYDFKSKLSKLTKERKAAKEATSNDSKNNVEGSMKLLNGSLYSTYESLLSTQEKSTLLHFETCQLNCKQRLNQDIPNFIKLNKNKYSIYLEKLDLMIKYMKTNILSQLIYQNNSNKLDELTENFNKILNKMKTIEIECAEEWKIPGNEDNHKRNELNESLINLTNEFDSINKNEYLLFSNQFDQCYLNFENCLSGIDNMCKNFEHSATMMAESKENDDMYDSEYGYGSKSWWHKKGDDNKSIDTSKSYRVQMYDENNHDSGELASARMISTHPMYQQRQRQQRQQNDSRSESKHSNNINDTHDNNIIFTLYNDNLIKTINNFGSDDFVLQRIIFNGSNHLARMIISDKGFDKGKHYWRFGLNNHCSNSVTKCNKKILPSIQIGIMSIHHTNSRFINKETNEPRFLNHLKKLHFFSKNADKLGFGLRYYLTYNMFTKQMNLGTLGSNHERVNFYIDLPTNKREHKLNYGDSITMELDCDKLTLRFWKNKDVLIGQEIWKNQFHKGTIKLMPNQTYFPAISCLGCDCQGPQKGFVVDILKP